MAIEQSIFDPKEDLSEFDMALPVTRHALMPEEQDFEFLLSGIDSLDLGMYVHWKTDLWSDLLGRLDACKNQAAKKKNLLDKMPDGRSFMHLPSGKPPNYRFHLQFADYDLFVGITNPPVNSPNVYVSLRAKALWFKGVSTLVNQISTDIQTMGGEIQLVQPSRCDLSADFYLPGDLTLNMIEEHKVTRSKDISHRAKSGQMETYYAGGPGAEILLRIYDKGKEIGKSGKDWFLGLWGRGSPTGVWRVEFQLRRSALKSWGIDSMDDLTEKLGGLWQYLTSKWFSLRHQDNSRQNRRTVLPWWVAVQNMPTAFGELKQIEKLPENDHLAPLDWYVSHMGGCLPSYAARRGTTDMLESFNQLLNDISIYWFERDFDDAVRKKTLKLGNEIESEDEDYDDNGQKMFLLGERNHPLPFYQ
jgi:hypothetical protein